MAKRTAKRARLRTEASLSPASSRSKCTAAGSSSAAAAEAGASPRRCACCHDGVALLARLPNEMSLKGSISYKNNNVNVVHLDAGTDMRLARVNVNVARIYFVSRATGQPVGVPAGVHVVQADGQEIAEFPAGAFLIVWTNDFKVMRGDEVLVQLTRQIQQSIDTDLETDLIKQG
eukprot:tig00000042_g15649.t1